MCVIITRKITLCKIKSKLDEKRLVISRWIHGANYSFHYAGCCQRCIRLPFFDSSTVLVIGNSADYNEILATIAQNAFYDSIHLCIKCERAESACKLLPKLIISCDLPAGRYWCQMNSGASISSNKILTYICFKIHM